MKSLQKHKCKVFDGTECETKDENNDNNEEGCKKECPSDKPSLNKETCESYCGDPLVSTCSEQKMNLIYHILHTK